MNPVPEAQAESGARLKALYLNGADGSKQFSMRWFDTARNEECTFRTFSLDGSKSVCLPSYEIVSYVQGYTDASCTSPLYALIGDCNQKLPKYVVVHNSAAACGAPPTLHLLGPKYVGDRYEKGTDGVCRRAMPGNSGFNELGAAVPSSSFVEATTAQ